MPSPVSPHNLLLIDDNEDLIRLITMNARSRGWRPVAAGDGAGGIALLDRHIRAVVLDYNLPDGQGIDILRTLRQKRADVPVVMLTGHNDAETAVRTIRAGADDYLTKPFSLDHLFTVIHEASRRKSQDLLREAVARRPETGSIPILKSGNTAMSSLLAQVRKVAPLDMTLLLTGESGTGKSHLARHIHALSPRANAAFIPVSCPALPAELLESEFFGHEKGAFTGASCARKGRFEMASEGTIFLDEIGDLPHELQPKLLTILQDREYFRVGGNKILKTDARVIAATNSDLMEKVRAGTFREDLFYRLNIMEIRMPSLRERPEDIPAIAVEILTKIASRRRVAACRISKGSLDLLSAQPWPGNIRELENFLERATAFAEGDCLEENHIQPLLASGNGHRQNLPPGDGHPGATGSPMSLRELEKGEFMRAYARCSGNRAAIARHLGVSERTVYNRLSQYGMK